MRRRLPVLLLFFALCLTQAAHGQFNKYYFYYMGRNFLRENQYRDAISILNILLKADEDAHEGYFLRGVAKYNLDDLHGAEQDFTVAIGKNPVYTLAYHYRAVTRSRLGDYDDALKDFKEAIDLRPDIPGPYYSRGVTFLLSQQFEKAIDDFNEFLKFEPTAGEAYIHKGTSYAYLKDTVSAFEAYEKAISINRENPDAYYRRGGLYLNREEWDAALADFDTAIRCDSNFIYPYFSRAIVYANTTRPMEAIRDLDRVIELDSTLSVAYFNRALLSTQIGDYNRALSDYDRVTKISPNNVLVYYNRANVYTELGFLREAIDDYTEAIERYPDFANAYLGRAELRYFLMDERGAREDRRIAGEKIAEYRSKLTDSTFSVYADTSRQFNRLLSFDPEFGRQEIRTMATGEQGEISLLPMFRFTLTARKQEDDIPVSRRYHNEQLTEFLASDPTGHLSLTNRDSDLSPDSLIVMDKTAEMVIAEGSGGWEPHFLRGITQFLIRQYTGSINSLTKAIDSDPSNPFPYINRSTVRTEMIDFISSIDNSYHNITIDSDPANRLTNTGKRTYNYDEAVYDLNKAAKLLPDFPYTYYNRANLHCINGNLAEALEDYTRAIELYPNFAEAYYNRGLVQIYLKDTRKGLLDISKAGELGISQSYEVLKKYGGGQ